MGKYILGRQAEADIDQIVDYIWADSPQSAMHFLDEVERICSLLGDMPHMGKKVEYIVTPEYSVFPAGKFDSYLVFYVIEEGVPVIVRVVHGRRDIEALFDED